jgi:hypothetical protein
MADATYPTETMYTEHGDGGRRTVVPSGASLDIESGAEIDIEAGAALKFGGTQATGGVQELTATGAVTAGIQSVELNHASVVIAATLADLAAHPGFLMVKDTSASGTAAHTVTAAAGTWDGTNTVVTLNAPDEAILVYIDSAGNGTIIENVGGVALS